MRISPLFRLKEDLLLMALGRLMTVGLLARLGEPAQEPCPPSLFLRNHVSFRILVKGIVTGQGAKIDPLSLVLKTSRSLRLIYLHATDGIFYHRHYLLFPNGTPFFSLHPYFGVLSYEKESLDQRRGKWVATLYPYQLIPIEFFSSGDLTCIHNDLIPYDLNGVKI
jgi:hypothetical protein